MLWFDHYEEEKNKMTEVGVKYVIAKALPLNSKYCTVINRKDSHITVNRNTLLHWDHKMLILIGLIRKSKVTGQGMRSLFYYYLVV
jgi:hypothetical protein